MTLDTVVGKVERVADGGNLLKNLALIDISTWQTSQEVWKTSQNDIFNFLFEGVNTANMGVYRLVNGEPVFDLLGREGNPFVDEQFREEAYYGILDNKFFFPQAEMRDYIMAAINTGQSVRVRYSKLRRGSKGCTTDYEYVQADGSNNDEDKKLFVAVYGTKNPRWKKVYLLSEYAVQARLREKKNELIIGACCFSKDQDFSVDHRNINDYDGAVRGVRRK